jgi:type 1 fimbria pilin
MKKLGSFAGLVCLLLLCFPVYAHAQGKGKLDIVGKFVAGDTVCNVATFLEGADRVGLVGIKGGLRISVAFTSADWGAFVNLWNSARQSQSASWKLVGTFKETGTTDPSLLTVTAGPGVQFTIMESTGTMSFVLQPGEFDRFDQSVRQVTAFLSATSSVRTQPRGEMWALSTVRAPLPQFVAGVR